MKTLKKVFTLCMALAMVLGLAACGGADKGFENATYATIYDNTMDAEILEALPENQFLLDDVRDGIAAGLTFELTLVLENMGDYTLVAHLYNPDQSDETAADYLEIRVGVVGTYTKDGDVVTLGVGEFGDASYHAGSDYAEDYKTFSFAEDGSNGDWFYESNPKILDVVTDGTTITVSGANIASWEIAE